MFLVYENLGKKKKKNRYRYMCERKVGRSVLFLLKLIIIEGVVIF